jgi:uncharacterized membrane protein YphA (DoxX/SURF4 family)
MHRDKLADLILRIGTAFAFLYPAINAYSNPYTWIGYFPKFTQGILPDMVLLHSFGVIEIIIALFILFGKNVFWSAVIASLMLAGIIIFNFRDFEILFRDVAILAMTISLAITHAPKKRLQ